MQNHVFSASALKKVISPEEVWGLAFLICCFIHLQDESSENKDLETHHPKVQIPHYKVDEWKILLVDEKANDLIKWGLQHRYQLWTLKFIQCICQTSPHRQSSKSSPIPTTNEKYMFSAGRSMYTKLYTTAVKIIPYVPPDISMVIVQWDYQSPLGCRRLPM